MSLTEGFSLPSQGPATGRVFAPRGGCFHRPQRQPERRHLRFQCGGDEFRWVARHDSRNERGNFNPRSRPALTNGHSNVNRDTRALMDAFRPSRAVSSDRGRPQPVPGTQFRLCSRVSFCSNPVVWPELPQHVRSLPAAQTLEGTTRAFADQASPRHRGGALAGLPP